MNIKPKHQNLLLYNIMPISCISFFIVLGLLTINPSISINKAHAEDDYIVYDVNNDAATYDLTDDGVVLEWDNRDSDYQTITGSNSEVLYRYNRFRVTAENIKKYQILANIADTANGTNGNKLTGYTNSEYNIPNGYSIDSISDTNGIVGKDLTSSTTSQWGYAITIGEVTTTDNLSNLTYKAVPPAASSDIGLTDNVTELNNQAFTIAFAANIADDKPAGSYRASVGVSIVVEPKPLTAIWSNGIDSGILYMQDMTSSVCNQVSTPSASETNVPTLTLRDSRVTNESDPGYQYATAKMADGNCWMTQNLSIINKDITPSDSDILNNFTVPASYLSGFTAEYQYQPRAYLDSTYGGFYNWYTATAGTGNSSVTENTNASNSICPKGWRLPFGKLGDTSSGSWNQLFDSYGNKIYGNTGFIFNAPLYFIHSGYVNNNSLLGVSEEGDYWSSTARQSTYASALYFTGSSGSANRSASSHIYNGFSIRCVAR